jgi:hypothetical protein
VRALIVIALCALMGIARQSESPETNLAVFILFTGLPVAFLLLVIAGIDWLVVTAWRKYEA